MNNVAKDVIWIYWTGGYDSTFVVLNFLIAKNGELTGARVQPVYLQNCDARRNSDIEEDTMRDIRRILTQQYPNMDDYLLPIIFVDCRQITLDSDIQQGMFSLYKSGKLHLPKSQYSYMAQMPRLFRHIIDSGAERAVGTVISQHVRPHLTADYMLDTRTSPKDLQIFSGVRFPVVMVTKAQMLKIAQGKGFADLLHKSWTCRAPKRIGNKIVACGKCEMCRGRIVPSPSLIINR